MTGGEGQDGFVASVPETLAGVRVDRAVSLLTGVSRSAAADLVAAGRVLVGGRPVADRSSPLVAGTELTVALPPAVPPGVAPDPGVAVTVVHADQSLVVVDKAAGVVVHPGAGRREGTLIAGIVARFPDIAALGETGLCDPDRPGVVHRLDRGTSGLLVVARTPDAYRSLAAQMAARTAGRRYLALVRGHLASDRGVVDAPIGRSARVPTRMVVSAVGRAARTSYEVLDRFEQPFESSLIACTLATGRTHQIRVHLAAIGHAVVGDDRYGPGRPEGSLVAAARLAGSLPPAGRLFLHAAELSLDHPATGRRESWSSPLPDDLAAVIGRAVSLPPLVVSSEG